MNIITVIPARGGSKGIPKKNLTKVCDKTLIAHAFDCVSKSTYAMDIVVSTDSIEILNHAKSIGYEGEYLRPKELAQDNSRTVDAVLDVIAWAIENNSKTYDVVIVLQPTSPFRLAGDLDAALDIFCAASDATSLVSVNSVHEHPVECVEVISDGWRYLVEPEASFTGRQSYGKNYFFINGAIYICDYKHLVQTNSFIDRGKSILFEMPKLRSIDIDTYEDITIANCLCNKIRPV